MKSVLSLHEAPSALERSIRAASKLINQLPTDLQMEGIPLKELSSMVTDIHVKTREASQNTNLKMREFLRIDKALQSILGELLNNTSKLTGIDKRTQRDSKSLEEVENDPTYTDEQRQLYGDLNTGKQIRLEILSQNRKDLQTQVARIKQTIKKVLDKNTALPERILTLFREQIITIVSILTALLAGIATIVPSAIGDFGGGGETGGSPPRDKRTFQKWLDRLADALKILAGKAV